MKKVQELANKINQKQIQYAEFANNLYQSMASNSGLRDSNVSQDQMFMNNKQEFKISDDDLRMAQDADFMANVIDQRKQDMDGIQSAMANINAMAKDLAIETDKQGAKLNTISDNLYEANN